MALPMHWIQKNVHSQGCSQMASFFEKKRSLFSRVKTTEDSPLPDENQGSYIDNENISVNDKVIEKVLQFIMSHKKIPLLDLPKTLVANSKNAKDSSGFPGQQWFF